MNSIEANIRDNSTKGQLNAIRNSGNVPAIIYGGKDKNQKISISKKLLKTFIEKENFFKNSDLIKKILQIIDKFLKIHIKNQIENGANIIQIFDIYTFFE